MISDVNETPSYSDTQTRYVAENASKLEGQWNRTRYCIRDTKTGKPATLASSLRPCHSRRQTAPLRLAWTWTDTGLHSPLMATQSMAADPDELALSQT